MGSASPTELEGGWEGAGIRADEVRWVRIRPPSLDQRGYNQHPHDPF